MPPPRNPATRTLRDEDLVSERRLPHPSVARDALERAVRREEARSRRDLLELPRAGADPELDVRDEDPDGFRGRDGAHLRPVPPRRCFELAELDPPLAAE